MPASPIQGQAPGEFDLVDATEPLGSDAAHFRYSTCKPGELQLLVPAIAAAGA